MRRTTLFVLLTLTFIYSSCTSQENLKEYYYQISSNKEIKVFKYIDKNDPDYIEYWKVTADPSTKRILTESFTQDFRLYNIFEEELNSDGAEMIGYNDYILNDNGENIRIESKIIENDVFKWDNNGKYAYSVEYKTPNYGREILTKARTVNSFEDIEVRGTKYSTLKLLDEYEANLIDHNQKIEFYQFTYYAEGIGMVKYQRYYSDGGKIELELDKILTEIEFNELREKASR